MTFPAIAASVMAADLACLDDEMRAMTHAGIDAFHWDIMDGHFVPNLTFGPEHIRQLRPHTPVYFDVHLMVTNPEAWIDRMAQAGADALSFHAELPHDPMTLLEQIKSHGLDAGIAVNPETDLSLIDSAVFPQLDRLLIMTVKPGFGGQNFIDQTAKIEQAAALREKYPHLHIVVDGGINLETAPRVLAAGATTLISGSHLFAQKNNYGDAIARLRGDKR